MSNKVFIFLKSFFCWQKKHLIVINNIINKYPKNQISIFEIDKKKKIKKVIENSNIMFFKKHFSHFEEKINYFYYQIDNEILKLNEYNDFFKYFSEKKKNIIYYEKNCKAIRTIIYLLKEKWGENLKIISIKHKFLNINKENIFKYWENIHQKERERFTKKICLIGTESSGKTTIAKMLADYFNVFFQKEYGRIYCQNIKKGYFYNNFFLTNEEDYLKIISGTNKLLNKIIGRTKFIFIDTDSIYTQYFFEKQYGKFSPLIDAVIEKENFDLYFFLKNNTKRLKNDDFRLIKKDNLLEEEEKLFKLYQNKYKKNVIIVQDQFNYQKRFKDLLKQITIFLKKQNIII